MLRPMPAAEAEHDRHHQPGAVAGEPVSAGYRSIFANPRGEIFRMPGVVEGGPSISMGGQRESRREQGDGRQPEGSAT